jgi:hypothetical protein
VKNIRLGFSLLIVVVLIFSGCVPAPVVEVKVPPTEAIPPVEELEAVTSVPTETVQPTSAPTDTPIPTLTPTFVPTDTPTHTPTSIPVYTELGIQINEIVEILGWEVVTCDLNHLSNDLRYELLTDLDALLYREDTQEYFCDLRGHMQEAVPESNSIETNGQWLLTLTEFGDMWHIPIEDGIQFALSKYFDTNYPYPSEYGVLEILEMNGEKLTPEEKREQINPWGLVINWRMWPLTREEINKILDVYNDPENDFFIEMGGFNSFK